MRQAKIILSLFILLFSMGAQAVDTTFIHTYGGLRYDRGSSCKSTLDGGVIMAGSTGSFGLGDADMYLVKVDAGGTFQWSQSYGGLFTENCHAMIETADTGFLMVGYTNSFGAGQYDMYLVKTDSIGDTIWTKTYGGTGWDFAYDVKQALDGSYLIIGETYSTVSGDNDVYVLKLDLNGDTIWTKTYGGSGQDFGRAIIELYDSTLVIAGGTSSFGSGGIDVLLLKLNAQGDSLWAHAHGGLEDDWARDVIVTNDTGISAVGITKSFNPNYNEMYHIKTDISGTNLQFENNWGQINNQEGFELMQRSNGNYLLFGYTMTSGGGGKDFILQEMDPAGSFTSGKTYGGNSDEEGYSLDMTADNGLILFGTTNGFGVGLDDFMLIKTDSLGNDSIGNPISSSYPIATYEDTSIPVTPVGIEMQHNENEKIGIYPMPISSTATINLSLFKTSGSECSFTLINSLGQIANHQIINDNSFTFNRSGLPDGFYTFLVTSDNHDGLKRSTGKIMIITK